MLLCVAPNKRDNFHARSLPVLPARPEQAIDQRSALSNKVLQHARIENAIQGDLQIGAGRSVRLLSVKHWIGCAGPPHVAFSKVQRNTRHDKVGR
jgi:hypothetical protein